jgi:hypothetical protein
MKILHPPPLSGLDQSRAKSLPGKGSSGFQEVFKDVIQSKTSPMDSPAKAFSSGGLIPPTAESLDPASSNQPLEMMACLVDALDAYQQRLGNPRYSLRDIEPSLEHLENAHARLLRLAENSPQDSRLQGIITEGLVTSATEIHRFRSGAYC